MIRLFTAIMFAAANLSLLAATAVAQETQVIRWSSAFSPMSINNQVSVPAFAEAIEEASGGALKVEHYAGGTLGKSPVQQLSMVENGVTDIAEVVTAYTPGRFPELAIFELPFLAKNNAEAGLAALHMYEKGLLSGFDDLHLAGIIISGPYGISAAKPLATLEDLKGLRLRAAGPIQTAMVQALGAVPVGNIPAPQIAENISRGLIDGTLMAPGNLYNFRIADAAKYHLFDLELGSVAVVFPIRKEAYDNLSGDAKTAFDQYAGDWLTRTLGTNLDKQEVEAREKIAADPEHTIHEWSEADIATARELLAEVSAEWDTETNGVNLYEEVQSAFETVRASN